MHVILTAEYLATHYVGDDANISDEGLLDFVSISKIDSVRNSIPDIILQLTKQ